MDVRDAVEADAEALASIADTPTDAMRNLIHDRTVRIVDVARPDADESGSSSNDGPEIGGSDAETVAGFVSFDAREETVHVTQLSGTEAACERLLAEPIRFATYEKMDVQLMVPETDDTARTAAERAGFDEIGTGPRFEGTPTVKYRLEP